MKTYKLQGRIGRIITFEGRDYLYFTGTSYLGIDQVPEYEALLLENIRKWGFNHGLSRINTVRLDVFDEFEERFAQGAKAEAAAVVSSGYLAGISAWQHLFPQVETCWIAPDTHPAILPDKIKPDFQLNFIQWKSQCLELSQRLSPQRILILGNAVDPLSSAIHDYSWVSDIAKKHEVFLLVDDSHAFGVIGEDLFGTYSTHFDPSVNLMISGSLGKGLAMPAGIIIGRKKDVEEIKSKAMFIGASPGSPANLQTFWDAHTIYQEQHRKIKELSAIFHDQIQDLSTILGIPEFPVFTYQDPSWAEKLEAKGFITSSFPYPEPNSPKINRIVLSGFHTNQDLFDITAALHEINQED